MTADAHWRAIHRAACAPYRKAGRFAWHFARGKLGRDPVYRALLERGDLGPGGHVVDIGCGQGLLASLLAAVDAAPHARAWPAHWAARPRATRYTGIDLRARDVRRARDAVGTEPGAPRFVRADMRSAALPRCDIVVLLDVLHYADHAAQQDLLERARSALQPGGRLLLRVGDARRRRAFVLSLWVDRVVSLLRGQGVAPDFGRPLTDWIALLQTLGFQVEAVPMSQGTPFANVLLVAQGAAPFPARPSARPIVDFTPRMAHPAPRLIPSGEHE